MKTKWLTDLQIAHALRKRLLKLAPTKTARERVYHAARVLDIEVKLSPRADGKGFDVKYVVEA